MLMKLRPGEGVAAGMAEPEKELKAKPYEEFIRTRVETSFRTKCGGVIPAKKRLVKRMMWDYIVKYIGSVFCFDHPSASAVPQPDSRKAGCYFKTVSPFNSSNSG
ncbi:hypothetical protein I3842_15G028800 [Carya illinoinensis]|uniref:Uncharacterized protein n=1 Tax=Carya illinoinensis TaxID=32201 RepID=A0A922A327_CARIL|nr:hypothetical protein I3842_15G028800 [Carya illinoinensis]